MAAHHSHKESLAEINRKFFDDNSKKVFEQAWVQRLTEQITVGLRSNIDWIAPRKPSGDRDPVKLLDYACGNGAASRALSDYFDVTRGADISGSMVESYNEIAREAIISPDRMLAVRGDITATDGPGVLPLSDFSDFDAVVMSMALHHMSEPGQVLCRLLERLRVDGVIIIVDWSMEGSYAPIPSKREATHDIVSRHGFDADEMRAFLVEAGCVPESVDFRLYRETSHLPEEVTHVPGGVNRTLFIAKGRKAHS